MSTAFSHALPFPENSFSVKTHAALGADSTKVLQDQQAQRLFAVEVRLLRQAKVFHWRNKGVEVPFIQIGMKFQGQGGFHVVLGLQVHLDRAKLDNPCF